MQSNFATTISFSSAATCMALTLLVAYLGRSAASRHFRYAAVSGLAACVYCLTDAVPAGDAGVDVTVWSGRASVLASSVHGAGWIAFLAAWDGRSLSRFERLLIAASLLVGVLALVPGAAFEDAVTDRTVRWSRTVYRDPVLAPLGFPVLALVGAEQLVAAVVAYRMRRSNPTAVFVALALGLFFVVIVVDWLTAAHLVALPDFVGPALALVFLSIGAVVVADAAASAAKSVALVRANVALAERENLAAVGQLAAVVAHEVRNPVAIIFGALTTLRRGPRAHDDEALLGIIDEEAERLKQLVSRLLDAVRPFELRYSSVGVEETVRAAVAHVTTSAGVAPELVELEGLPAGDVECDHVLLEQAISNLVQNALVAPGRRSPVRVTARVELDPSPGSLRIAVTDDGEGVSPEARARLFTPFFTTRASGTGLGLALVKRIVEAHGGDVTHESPAGGGASFVLRLPLRERDAAAHLLRERPPR
jgi:signal transduction histidine kinase